MKRWVLFITLIMVFGAGLLGLLWPGIEGRYLNQKSVNGLMGIHFSDLIQKSFKDADPELLKEVRGLRCQFLDKQYRGIDCVFPFIHRTGFQMVMPSSDKYCESAYYIRHCRQAYFHQTVLNSSTIHQHLKMVMKNPCPYLRERKDISNLLGCGRMISVPIWLTYVDAQGSFVMNEVVR